MYINKSEDILGEFTVLSNNTTQWSWPDLKQSWLCNTAINWQQFYPSETKNPVQEMFGALYAHAWLAEDGFSNITDWSMIKASKEKIEIQFSLTFIDSTMINRCIYDLTVAEREDCWIGTFRWPPSPWTTCTLTDLVHGPLEWTTHGLS